MPGVNFELAGGLIIVPVFVNKRGPFYFALDTGASNTILARELAEELGVRGVIRAQGLGAGGSLDVRLGVVEELRIGSFELRDLTVGITDLSALKEALGRRIDGIIGYDVLKDAVVVIDYRAQRLDIKRPRGP